MKKRVLEVSLKIAVAIILIIGFVIINDVIKDNRSISYLPIDGNDWEGINYTFHIDSADYEDDKLILSGWYIDLKNVRNVQKDVDEIKDICILLHDINDKEEYNIDGTPKRSKGLKMDVSKQKRTDVNQYFLCEYDYSDCGFIATIDSELLDIQNGKYQVVFKKSKNDEQGIIIGYFVDGKIQYVDPKDNIELNIQGTDLEKIVNEGTCLVSCPDFHICVYQFQKSLYWIAGKEYSFEEDGSTYIQCMVDTTQFDKLPSDRLQNGWYTGSIGSNFESNELTGIMECGEYRVFSLELPTEYSLTRLVTGYNIDDNWIWTKAFRPDYLYLINK